MKSTPLDVIVENIRSIALAKGYHEEEINAVAGKVLAEAFEKPPVREIKSIEVWENDGGASFKFGIGDRVLYYNKSNDSSYPLTVTEISIHERGVHHTGVNIIINGIDLASDRDYRIHRFSGVEKACYRLEHYPLK